MKVTELGTLHPKRTSKVFRRAALSDVANDGDVRLCRFGGGVLGQGPQILNSKCAHHVRPPLSRINEAKELPRRRHGDGQVSFFG
jgi:hypothetical protein